MMQAGRMLKLTALMSVLAVAGCLGGGSPQLRYYTLTPIDQQPVLGASSTGSGAPSILIMPATLPGYLERTGIVSFSGANVFNVAESHRWAEPLSENVSRVLARNLSALVPTENVFVFPARDGPADYVVGVDILNFGGGQGRPAVLEALWTLKSEDSKKDRACYKAHYVEPVRDESYDALVSAMSKALEKLSRDISGRINEDMQSPGLGS